MNFDLGNTTVVEKLTNTKEVSKELKQEAIKYIETLQTLVNQLSLQPVISSNGEPHEYMNVSKALRNIEMVERGWLSDIQTKEEIIKENLEYIKKSYSI